MEPGSQHAPCGRRGACGAALAVAVAWLAVALPLLPDFGPVWDEVRGDIPWGHLRLRAMLELDPAWLADGKVAALELPEPHPALIRPIAAPMGVYSIAGVASAISCLALAGQLGVLAPLAAHHLIAALFAAALAALLVAWAGRRLGALTGVLAAALLLSAPRFFADALHNMKDVAEAALYVAASLASLAAIRSGRLRDAAGAGTLAGLALAQKMNGLLIPVQLALYLAVLVAVPRWRAELRPRLLARGIALALPCAALAFLAASPAWWFDPVGECRAWVAYVLEVGRVARPIEVPQGGGAVLALPLLDAFSAVREALYSTPLPLLVFLPFGLASRRLAGRERLFLALGVLVPVLRGAAGGLRNYDGVRHLLEFLPPLALLAAVGVEALAAALARALPRLGRGALPLVGLAALLPGAVTSAATHPNGICSYNALAGGLGGARERGLDAVDYWGNSLWQGLDWVNAHAPTGARVVAPVANHVLRAAAPLKLRADLALGRFEVGAADVPRCVLLLLHPSWYDPLARHLLATEVPVHAIECQGAPILNVYRIDDPGRIAAASAVVAAAAAADARVQAWVRAHPARGVGVLAVLSERGALGFERAAAALAALLPPELQEDGGTLIR